MKLKPDFLKKLAEQVQLIKARLTPAKLRYFEKKAASRKRRLGLNK